MKSQLQHKLLESIQRTQQRLAESSSFTVEGKLTRVVGLALEAVGCEAPIGSRCYVTNHWSERVEAEVVGFAENKIYLMCLGDTYGISPGARINLTGKVAEVPVGEALLGRILDGAGKPLDGGGPLSTSLRYPLHATAINPLTRPMIDAPLDVGVRSINSLLTVGNGQRMGLFAGSGVGKSVLLGMMTRYTSADVVVVGLVGERGREVKEFIENNLGPEGLARAAVIVAPADQPPLMRMRAAMWATSIAEYFRDQGANVLLLMDSLTRFAQAQREIALAIGEPPATKGYPPSVFARLPQLIERTGRTERGSITAFYTVLAEGDDQQEPIADSARAILDGHIVLSRELAEAGHYPAVEIETSISRVMDLITTPDHLVMARRFKQLYAKYRQNRDLIHMGAYVAGSDPELDYASTRFPYLEQFLRQDMHEASVFPEGIEGLKQLVGASADPPAEVATT